MDTSFKGTGKVTTAIGNYDYGYGVAVQNDGRIVVVGKSSIDGSNPVFALARYEGAQPGISGPQTVNLGSPVTFTAIPARPNPLTYQWSKDGVNIPGATGSSDTIPSVQLWNIGDYKVVVTDAYGITTSDAALLQITNVSTGVWRGLIAYYQFDGNALDREAGGSQATVSGASLTADRFRQSNRAFAFDGTSSRMTATIPNLPVGSEPRTLSLWAKANPDPSREAGLVEWGAAASGQAFGIASSGSPYTWNGKTYGADAWPVSFMRSS